MVVPRFCPVRRAFNPSCHWDCLAPSISPGSLSRIRPTLPRSSPELVWSGPPCTAPELFNWMPPCRACARVNWTARRDGMWHRCCDGLSWGLPVWTFPFRPHTLQTLPHWTARSAPHRKHSLSRRTSRRCAPCRQMYPAKRDAASPSRFPSIWRRTSVRHSRHTLNPAGPLWLIFAGHWLN